MKWLKLQMVMLFGLMSLQTHALLLVDIQKDIAVGRSTAIEADMTTHGFDPRTDRITRVDLFLYFRELHDDSLTDMPGDETAEFVGFNKILFGERASWDADVDTGLYRLSTMFYPTDKETCLWWDEFYECVFDPVRTGMLFITVRTTPDTLWLDEVRWEVDVLRTKVDESASLILLTIGLCMLGLSRRLKN